jgi:hypothetical protein
MDWLFGSTGTFEEEYKSYVQEGCADTFEAAKFEDKKVVARAVRTSRLRSLSRPRAAFALISSFQRRP